MRNKFYYLFLLCIGLLILPNLSYAQVEKPTETDAPTDDLGDVSDAFQELFFEALKQKGIENYELALIALDKAETAAKGDPDQMAAVYFEKAKNLTQLKRYEEAEVNYNKVLLTQNDRLDVMQSLYDLYYLEKDYDKAIILVQRLISFDEDYKEDLANLYARTKQYDKATDLLDELDIIWGESDERDVLRSQIYRETGNTSGQIEKLEEKLESKSKSEKDFLNLIYLYSEQGNSEKAFETAKELLAAYPNSQWVHLALYKFYLENGDTSKAMTSIRIVFSSDEIDDESKYKVLGDFIGFVNENPAYEKDLEEVVALFSSENNGKIYEELGNYYLAKEMKEEALKFYEKGIAIDLDNFSLLRRALLLQIDFKKYEDAVQLSYNALELFPAQPLLYLVNGVANLELNNVDLAIESLETGLDYLYEDLPMQVDFYEQLSIAYTKKGNLKKAEEFAKKALELKNPN